MRKAVMIGMAAATATIGGCGEARSENGGPAVERAYTVGNFERIEVAGAYDVEVRTGPAASVRATGGQRDVDRMIVEVRGDTLSIHPKKRNGMSFGWSRHEKVRLTVTVPALRGAEIAGSGDMRIDRVTGDAFDGTVAGSGSLRVGQLQVARVKMGIAGSGEIRADGGRAGEAEYEIAGSGDINMGKVVSDTASVEIAGSGNVEANATRTASVEIAGSGDVRLSGGAKCSVSKAGSGNVECS